MCGMASDKANIKLSYDMLLVAIFFAFLCCRLIIKTALLLISVSRNIKAREVFTSYHIISMQIHHAWTKSDWKFDFLWAHLFHCLGFLPIGHSSVCKCVCVCACYFILSSDDEYKCTPRRHIMYNAIDKMQKHSLDWKFDRKPPNTQICSFNKAQWKFGKLSLYIMTKS